MTGIEDSELTVKVSNPLKTIGYRIPLLVLVTIVQEKSTLQLHMNRYVHTYVNKQVLLKKNPNRQPQEIDRQPHQDHVAPLEHQTSPSLWLPSHSHALNVGGSKVTINTQYLFGQEFTSAHIKNVNTCIYQISETQMQCNSLTKYLG